MCGGGKQSTLSITRRLFFFVLPLSWQGKREAPWKKWWKQQCVCYFEKSGGGECDDDDGVCGALRKKGCTAMFMS